MRNDRPAFTRGGEGTSSGALYFHGGFWRLCQEGDGRTEDGWNFSQSEKAGREGLVPTGLWLRSNATEESYIDYTGLTVNPKDVNEGGSPVCAAGHRMAVSTFAEDGYEAGWNCNVCRLRGFPSTTPRWFCQTCEHDICTDCIPEKGSQQTGRQRDSSGCELVAAVKPCGFAQTRVRKDWSPLNLADGADVEIAVRAAVFLTSPDLGGVDGALLPFFSGSSFGGFGSGFGNARQHTQLRHCRGVVSRTGAWLGNSQLIEIQLPDGHITISDKTASPSTAFGGNNEAPWEALRSQQTVILANLDQDLDSAALERAINVKLTELKQVGGRTKIDESMDTLLGMGFDHNLAAAALLLADYDANEAASMLTDERTRVETAVLDFYQRISPTSDGMLIIDPHNDPRKSRLKVCPRGHPLVETVGDNGWACDGRHLPGGCKRNCTGFDQSAGWGRFHCGMCDYDLCDRCHAESQGYERLFRGQINFFGTNDVADASAVRAELAGGKCSGRYAAVRCQNAEQAVQIEAVMKGFTATNLHNRPMKSCLGPSLIAVGKLVVPPADAQQPDNQNQFRRDALQTQKSEAFVVESATGCVAYVSTLDLSVPCRVFRDACCKLWAATPEILLDRRVRVLDSASVTFGSQQPGAQTHESLFVASYIDRYSKHLLVPNAESPTEVSCELPYHIPRATVETPSVPHPMSHLRPHAPDAVVATLQTSSLRHSGM